VKQSDLWDAIATVLHTASQATSPAAKHEHPHAAKKHKPNGQALHILLAEDNAVNQQLAVQLLEKRGHAVKIAENGQEALDALQQEDFDLVLMDVQMPVMGGLEAATEIRRREQATREHVPIVAMTAHAMDGDREKCLEAGMDGYVSKPIDPRTFLDTVEALGGSSYAGGDGHHGPAGVDGRKAFNAEALLERFAGNRKLLRAIMKTFREDCPTMMARIREALKKEDCKAIAEAAHALKGSVGNFGETAAFESAREIEKKGRQGKLDGTWETYAALEDDIALLLPALQSIGEPKKAIKRRRPQHPSGRKR
jgi:two-component system, sensor histidine kinase and response regulator